MSIYVRGCPQQSRNALTQLAPSAPVLQLLPEVLQAAACQARLLNLPCVCHRPLHLVAMAAKLQRLLVDDNYLGHMTRHQRGSNSTTSLRR